MRTSPFRSRTAIIGAAAVAALTLGACSTDDSTDDSDASSSATSAPQEDSSKGTRAIAVSASDKDCELSTDSAISGTLTFTITNEGEEVTEFYFMDEAGKKTISEAANIAPGLTRDLVVIAEPGKYTVACKPGGKGEGNRTKITVTDSGEETKVTAADQAKLDEATGAYKAFVATQIDKLVTETERFAELVKDGKDDEARALYAPARMYWESVEPVAESFGDLDPAIDAREADLEAGDDFTGWHRLEKDLWPARAENYTPMTAAERTEIADKLVKDTLELQVRTQELELTIDQIANGAKELLDEVATGKITGEEEYWSRTDLYDFQANVDGARKSWEVLRPVLEDKDPALDKTLNTEFTDMQNLLDNYKKGDGFVNYDELSKEDVKKLSDAVNSLAEPLSMLAAAVVS